MFLFQVLADDGVKAQLTDEVKELTTACEVSCTCFYFIFIILGVKTVTRHINLTVSPCERVVKRNLGQVRLAMRSAFLQLMFFKYFFLTLDTCDAFYLCMA
jgi:hypothetical protein